MARDVGEVVCVDPLCFTETGDDVCDVADDEVRDRVAEETRDPTACVTALLLADCAEWANCVLLATECVAEAGPRDHSQIRNPPPKPTAATPPPTEYQNCLLRAIVASPPRRYQSKKDCSVILRAGSPCA